jgi:uncharacterized BrkB/YihY/UPF0761 family membrane protein
MFEQISKSDARKVITVISLIALVAFLILIFTCEIPNNNKDLAYVVGGAFIGSCISSIFNYYFGSSQGSADKQQQINTMISDE